MRALNVGSGQRRFDTTKGWFNLDIVSRPPDQVPDVIAQGNHLPFADNTFDYVVLHQVLEHETCGGGGLLEEGHRTLKPGGSLLIFLPDIRALATRWLTGQISDYIYVVNLMGAYMGLESDRHKWHYTPASLEENMRKCGQWAAIRPFDWVSIPGTDLARDWWVLAYEGVK